MIIFPAIDLYDGKAVRLLRGDYENMTVYSNDPLSVARDFVSCGAEYVHIVDLQGAKDGNAPNLPTVERIAKETPLFVEIGGGIRDMETADRYFSCGVSRAILGTAAVTDVKFLEDAVDKYGEKIAVGADVRDGFIAIKGWTEKSSLSLDDFLCRMQNAGVKNVICTDISKDGAMAGTNLSLYKRLSEKYTLNITASGGVSSQEDILHLRDMGLYGAIIGKAYYIGKIDLEQAVKAVK